MVTERPVLSFATGFSTLGPIREICAESVYSAVAQKLKIGLRQSLRNARQPLRGCDSPV